MARTRKMDDIEVRVIGALLEKEQTTPDQYPLSLNAVIAACNQSTNREPVMKLSEDDVASALDRLRRDVLVWRTDGARVERWKQSVGSRWGLDPAAKAIMTLLLLRGPQTPGELRTRSDRLHAFASVEEVERALARMSEGLDALVAEMPRRPGQRETRWHHLVGTSAPESFDVTPTRAPRIDSAAPQAEREPDDLFARVRALEDEVARLRAELDELRATQPGC